MQSEELIVMRAKRGFSAGLTVVALMLLLAITASAQSLTTNIAVGKAPVAVAVNPTTNTIFVVNENENTVSIINGANNTSRKVGTSPQCTAITLDAVRNKAYVLCPSTQAVIIVDGNSNAVSGTGLAIPGTPSAIAFNPVTNKIYVTTSANNGTFNELDIIDGADPFNTPILHLTVGIVPTAVAINQVTNTIYVSNAFDPSVTVIDGATSTIKTTISLEKIHSPGLLAVNPVTNKIYVLDEGGLTDMIVINGATNAATIITTPGLGNFLAVNPVTNKIYVTDVNNQSVDVIDGSTDTLKTSISTLNPDTVAIDTATNTVYVDSVDTFTAPFGDLIVFNGATDSKIKTIPTGNITSTFQTPIVALDPVTNKVYVADVGTNDVAVIDGASNLSTNVITDATPAGIAFNPVNGMYYVSTINGTVDAIDTLHNNAVTSINVGGSPTNVAVCIPTNEIYVLDILHVIVISGVTNSVVASIPLPASSNFIRVNNATDTVYVSSDTGIFTAINANTHLASTVNIGGSPGDFDINPVTNKIYVSNQDGSQNNVAVIDGVTNTVLHTINLGKNSLAVAVNPATNTVYVANLGSKNVSVINGASDTKTADVALDIFPFSIVLNQFTNKVYLASFSDNLVDVIDGTNNNKSTIAVGKPFLITVNPTTNKIYTANINNNTVTVIDGATNFANTFATVATPTTMAINPVTNQVAVGSANSTNVAILSEQQTQPIPLTVTIPPVPGNVDASGVIGEFISAASAFSPTAPPPQNVFFQLDTLQGVWTRATPFGNSEFDMLLSPQLAGTHTIYAFATDGQEGQGISPASNLIGQITAYVFTVQPGLTITTVTPDISPSVFGQTVSFTINVTSINQAATGIVGLQGDGGSLIGTAPLVNGKAVIKATNLSVGTHTILASFSPNTNAFLPSASPILNYTVNQAQVQTSLLLNNTPSVFGQTVTFSTTVSALPPGAGTPTGTVTFSEGANNLGTVALDVNGKATFSTNSLSAGNHLISVSYNGDTNFAALQAGASNTQVVNQDAVQTTLVSSFNPSIFSQNVTFTATVSAKAPGAGTPTGTVTFLDGGTAIGTGTLAAGKTTFSTNSLSVGTHTITINYGGDTNFLTLTTGSTITQTVNKAPTTTTLATSITPSVFGQQVTFTATVVSAAPAAMVPSPVIGRSMRPRSGLSVVTRARAAEPLAATPIPTGTVTFFDGATQIGTGTLNASGQATFTTGALSVGTHTITAVYGGDGNYLSSTSSSLTQVVNKANTNTVVTSSAALAFVGGTVTYTATIVPVAPGAGTPTGFVQFRDNGINIGVPVALSGAKASVVESGLTPGNHVITAIYTGDGNFNASNGVLPGGQNVGFQFVDTVSGNTLIVTPAANGQSGNGSYTWLNNGTPVVSNVPALIQFNTQTLRIQTTSPAMFALFDASTHVGQATLFDSIRNRSLTINIASFVLQ